jgi:hypothetical protein
VLGWRRTFDEDDEVVLEPPTGSPEDALGLTCYLFEFVTASM